jgi:N-methylhydantoinase B
MSYRFLEPGTVSIHDDRWFVPPWGVNGGAPGARARKIHEKADGTQTIVANKLDRLDVAEGDILHFITWGGGGWGDPLARDPALVGKEIRQGLVSLEGARAYGVVADAKGKIDEAATEMLRSKLRSERAADLPLFDYGPDLATLRARSEADTGLPAPRQPVWHTTALAAE